MRINLALATLAATFVTAASTPEPTPDTILVKKGDVTVTVGDFLASIARLPEDQRFSFRADVQRITASVSALYMNRVLANEARAAGIDKEPEVRRRLQLAEEQLLAQMHMERFEKGIKTPDYTGRAREVYTADPERFTTPEKVKFRHILVNFQGRTRDEARRRAEEARQKLVAQENFTRVAREYSNDPTFRGNDGVIGLAPYSALIPQLAEAAKKAPLNETSDLIESPEGFHVISVLERRAASVTPFEQAKKNLIAADEGKYRQGVIEKRLAEITRSKEITLYTDEIAALKTELDRDLLRRQHEEQADRAAKPKAPKGG